MAHEIRATLQVIRVADALLAAPASDHYGYDLCKQTGLKSGVLYPILARLEAAEWVTSGWEGDGVRGGPRRRYYRLTPSGTEMARRCLASHHVTPS